MLDQPTTACGWPHTCGLNGSCTRKDSAPMIPAAGDDMDEKKPCGKEPSTSLGILYGVHLSGVHISR